MKGLVSTIDIRRHIWILNLHGGLSKREKCPDGSSDENVFDIQQGVGISIWFKSGKGNEISPISYADVWGSRESKYSRLSQESVSNTSFAMIEPSIPNHFFIPKDFNLDEEYSKFVSLTDIFKVGGNAIKTDRDDLFFSDTRIELVNRIHTFFSADGVSEPFRTTYRVENSSSYPILQRRVQTCFDEKCISQCMYRPFDIKYLYYSKGLTSRPAWDVMCHMLEPQSLGLLSMRQYEYDIPEYCYIFVTDSLVECRVFVSNRGIANCFPLYNVLGNATQQAKLRIKQARPSNYRPHFLDTLSSRLGIRQTNDGLPEGISHRDIFDYMYAAFHSHKYRIRYAEFLKIDFPRLPITGDLVLFRHLARLGSKLVAFHLLDFEWTSGYPTLWTGRIPSVIVDKIEFGNNTVWIDKSKTSGFSGLTEALWSFRIGGYQVCDKWLKDRKGRRLSADDIAHYQKIIIALSETIHLMAEIDQVIDAHGGWPNAFSSAPK